MIRESDRQIWNSVCEILRETGVREQIAAWVEPLHFDGLAAGAHSGLAGGPSNMLVARLVAPNDFSANWVRSHLKSTIEGALSQVTGSPCLIEVLASETPQGAVGVHEASLLSQTGSIQEIHDADTGQNRQVSVAPMAFRMESGSPVLATGARMPQEQNAQAVAHLDTHFRFDNFVVGASNQFAHASAIAVAEMPGRQYNPLYVYGPPGLGKTHLLHAIGNQILARQPDARVIYLSAERFVNELIESITKHRQSAFRAKYRDSYDAILIDDIQFIAGKNSSEEEFFHTFNALHASRRQIVVTSDRPPQEMERLEERIRTRFQMGLIVDVGPPEIETRIAILKTKAVRDDIYLPDDVSTFLATHVKSNVRELEGVLIKLQAVASLSGAEISLEMARQELRHVLPSEDVQMSAEPIQQAVVKHFGIKMQDLKSTSRARKYAFPRQIAMYLIRKYTSMGYVEIGNCFGGKDHTTVVHAFQKIEREIEEKPEVRAVVESIQNLL